jgi:hypothetical protein
MTDVDERRALRGWAMRARGRVLDDLAALDELAQMHQPVAVFRSVRVLCPLDAWPWLPLTPREIAGATPIVPLAWEEPR